METEIVGPETQVVVSQPPLGKREEPILTSAISCLWHSRRYVAAACLVGFLVAAAVAFTILPRYEATTRLMPPNRTETMGLALLASKMDDNLSSLVSNALGMKSSGALFIGILQSRTVEDRLIARFDLRRVYGVRLWKDARQRLEENTDIDEDRKSGIIALTVTDTLPTRAAEIARGYVEELDRLNAELTTSVAHRERVFIEERLKAVKQDLDSASRELSQFSSRNTTVDIQEQAKAMVEAAAKLQGELIAAQAQLSSLRQIYTDNNVRVRALAAHVAELQRQLSNLRGTDAAASQGEVASSGAPYPSIKKLPLLGVTYYDLYRRVKIQEAVFETLTKQYEVTKIQEAKEIPSVRVLDEANIPEKKSRPHRLLMMALGVLLGGLFATAHVLAAERWRSMGADHPARILGMEVQGDTAQHLRRLREQIPYFLAHRNGNKPE